MRTFFREFKDFIATGNMVELAVAVILGAAITAVISAFTQGIVIQIVAAIVGEPDFSEITITLRKNVGTDDNGNSVDSVLQIGTLINALITLLITGLVLYLLIKGYNRLKRAKPDIVAPTDVELLTEISDLLAAERQA